MIFGKLAKTYSSWRECGSGRLTFAYMAYAASCLMAAAYEIRTGNVKSWTSALLFFCGYGIFCFFEFAVTLIISLLKDQLLPGKKAVFLILVTASAPILMAFSQHMFPKEMHAEHGHFFVAAAGSSPLFATSAALLLLNKKLWWLSVLSFFLASIQFSVFSFIFSVHV